MSFVLLMLVVIAGAVVLTLAVTFGFRLAGVVADRRLSGYLDGLQDHLVAYVVEARDDPPPPPRGRFQQRAMRQRLVELAPSVKGDASGRLAQLFRSYELVAEARTDLYARDAIVQVRAIEALAAMQVEEAIPWLEELLTHQEPLLVLACARALAALGATGALPAAMTALAGTAAEPGEVSEILLSFGPDGVPFLCERVQSGAPAERRLSAAALGEIGTRLASPALRGVLGDDDDELVTAAARALGQIGDGRAAPEILALAQAPERTWFVRVAAAGALGAFDDPGAAPALARLLADDSWDVRNAASRALAGLGPAGVEAVAAALPDLPDLGIAHFAGTLDVGDQLEPVIRQAGGGDPAADRLVRRAAGAGTRARLQELAVGDGPAAGYARELLDAVEVGA